MADKEKVTSTVKEGIKTAGTMVKVAAYLIVGLFLWFVLVLVGNSLGINKIAAVTKDAVTHAVSASQSQCPPGHICRQKVVSHSSSQWRGTSRQQPLPRGARWGSPRKLGAHHGKRCHSHDAGKRFRIGGVLYECR